MRDLPAGFQVGELYCFPQGESGREFAYVPGSPRIELQGDGRPAVGLLSAPPVNVLSTQTVWSAEAAELDAVVREIEARYHVADARVRMADLSDATATLAVRRSDGTGQSFGPQPTSGMEPHRAAFSEHLTTADVDAVRAALAGRSGALTIVYRATLIVHESLATQIDGDLAEDLKALAPKPVEKKKPLFGLGQKPEPTAVPAPDLAACAARVDDALAAGRLSLTTTATPNASSELRSRIETALRSGVARYLYDQLSAVGEDAQYVSALAVHKSENGVEDVHYSLERTLDVGAWLAGHAGSGALTSSTQ
jgi:hypothetical protein